MYDIDWGRESLRGGGGTERTSESISDLFLLAPEPETDDEGGVVDRWVVDRSEIEDHIRERLGRLVADIQAAQRPGT
jgi:hypothetical protein